MSFFVHMAKLSSHSVGQFVVISKRMQPSNNLSSRVTAIECKNSRCSDTKINAYTRKKMMKSLSTRKKARPHQEIEKNFILSDSYWWLRLIFCKWGRRNEEIGPTNRLNPSCCCCWSITRRSFSHHLVVTKYSQPHPLYPSPIFSTITPITSIWCQLYHLD